MKKHNFNTVLIEKMTENSYLVEMLAQELDISHKELFLKIIGILDFTANDAAKIADILEFTEDDLNHFIKPELSRIPFKTVSVEIPEYMLNKIQEAIDDIDIFASCTISEMLQIVLLEGIGSQLVSGC